MTIATFTAKAPTYMRRLMEDFDFSVEDAAAIMGNAGHESGGLSKLQEIKPLVKGSRGGYGWFQWTGPRRKAYEAYCARNNLNPSADESNYAFLVVELKGSERGAVKRTKAAKGLEAKVVAFEKSFERAGIKHYPSRITWAKRALAAWKAVDGKVPAPKPQPSTTSTVIKGGSSVVVIGGAAVATKAAGFPWGDVIVIAIVAAVVVAAFLFRKKIKDAILGG